MLCRRPDRLGEKKTNCSHLRDADVGAAAMAGTAARSRLCASAEASLGQFVPEHGVLGCRGRHAREAGAGAPARRRQWPTCWPRLWPGLVRARAGTHGCRGRIVLHPLAARGRGSTSPAPAARADGAGSRPRGRVGCLPARPCGRG